MANKRRQYSYVEQKNYVRRIRRGLFWLFIFFVVYSLVTGLFFSSRALENSAMEPGCRAGDRFIFSNYTLNHLFRSRALAGLPFKRGQIVLVERSTDEKRGVIKLALDAALRFCTFQRKSLFPREDRVFIKRVIALPGDTVSISSFGVKIIPAGDTYEYTEAELSEKDYIPSIPQISILWDESIPFSSSMEKVTLNGNECFVLSDDRSNTGDSRTWGPLPVASVTGRALFRYWPPSRIGFP